MKEHLLLLLDLVHCLQHPHPHNARWGTCASAHMYTYTKTCTHQSPHHKFRNSVSIPCGTSLYRAKHQIKNIKFWLCLMFLHLGLLHFFLFLLPARLFLRSYLTKKEGKEIVAPAALSQGWLGSKWLMGDHLDSCQSVAVQVKTMNW